MEKEYKDQLKKHLNNVIDNILVAEVKTYKYSITEEERNPRCYVLSTFSMCMATIPITETITVYDSVKKVVEEFKSTEFSNIPNEELKEFYVGQIVTYTSPLTGKALPMEILAKIIKAGFWEVQCIHQGYVPVWISEEYLKPREKDEQVVTDYEYY